MKRWLTGRRAVALLVIAALATGGVSAFRQFGQRRSAIRYVTRPAGYADISSTVTETGTVNPIDQVLVGTQVSGTIATLAVEYNSRVKKGQVLATLDPTTFQAAVEQASAAMAAAQSNATASQSSLAQAQVAVQTAQANYAQAQGGVRNAEAAVTKAGS